MNDDLRVCLSVKMQVSAKGRCVTAFMFVHVSLKFIVQIKVKFVSILVDRTDFPCLRVKKRDGLSRQSHLKKRANPFAMLYLELEGKHVK